MRSVERPPYSKPNVQTVEAQAILKALGPVSAGSGQASSTACGPMLQNYCP